MVQGQLKQEKIVLSKELILKLLSPYDIFRHYLGEFKLNTVMVNTLRGETNPSLIVGDKFGELTFKDFGDYRWRGDCFSFVMCIYSCSFDECLKHIDKDFNLGIQKGEITLPEINWMPPEKTLIKPAPFFQIVTRKYNRDELAYWNELNLDIEDLKKGEIYVPKTIYRNRKKMYLGTLLTFCYFYPELNVWKIYRPHAPSRTKTTPFWNWKWDTGAIPFDYCDGLNDFTASKYGFLTKARKDRMYLRKILGTNNVADVQAEDPACINESAIAKIKEFSDIQVSVFDADKKGKESSWWLTNTYEFKHCNVPDIYLKDEIKDFPDMGKTVGHHLVYEHFKEKGYVE